MNTLTNKAKQVLGTDENGMFYVSIKRALTVLLLIISLSFISTAQTAVKQDANGNYTVITADRKTASNTGKTFVDKKGNKYPIFKSVNGKFFIERISQKTGNKYKQYLDITALMNTPARAGYSVQIEQETNGIDINAYFIPTI